MRIVYWPRPCLTLRLLARGSFASMLHTRRPPVRDVCSHGRNTIAPICPLHRPATWSSSWAPPLPQLLRHTPSSSHPNGGCSTLAAGSGVDLSALGIDIPDIDADVASYQSQLGAVFDVSPGTVPDSTRPPASAMCSACAAVAPADTRPCKCHWLCGRRSSSAPCLRIHNPHYAASGWAMQCRECSRPSIGYQ
jgi:hypothetical protein